MLSPVLYPIFCSVFFCADSLFTSSPSLYVGGIVIGFVAVLAETFLLSFTGKLVYAGHMIGYGIMAVSLSSFALVHPEPVIARFFRHARSYARSIYSLHQPVGILLPFMAGFVGEKASSFVFDFAWISIFFLCLILAFLFDLIREFISPGSIPVYDNIIPENINY